jgi:hypothetical protein
MSFTDNISLRQRSKPHSRLTKNAARTRAMSLMQPVIECESRTRADMGDEGMRQREVRESLIDVAELHQSNRQCHDHSDDIVIPELDVLQD